MRNLTSALVLVIGAGILSLPVVRAQDESDRSTAPQSQPQQHQQVTPSPGDSNRRDQSAQAPHSPAVVAPPATGDHNVITPRATGDAKTPVIPPPGTPGDRSDVQPN